MHLTMRDLQQNFSLDTFSWAGWFANEQKGLFETKGPDALGKFLCILRKNCHYSRETNAPGDFLSHQILSSITKLHRRRRPAFEKDKFLSGAKTAQILQFARHDLKKKFLSAPTITKLKIWQRQILTRFLDRPNKFCKSGASGP